jgi:hypothetical protein
MKVLSIFMKEFSYTPSQKNLEEVPEITEGRTIQEAVVAFIQVEEADEQYDAASREKKLVNHLKWVARKNNTNKVVLHSFAHLAATKASADFTTELFNMAEKRLINGGYETFQTPFGYFLNLKIDAPGFSLARIWAEL